MIPPEEDNQSNLNIGPDLKYQLPWILQHPSAHLLKPSENQDLGSHAKEICRSLACGLRAMQMQKEQD
jgi:hypothetical protein